jgi:hypothetical protein
MECQKWQSSPPTGRKKIIFRCTLFKIPARGDVAPMQDDGLEVWTATDCFDGAIACVMAETEFKATCLFTDAFAGTRMWQGTIRLASAAEVASFFGLSLAGERFFGPEKRVALMFQMGENDENPQQNQAEKIYF